MPNHLSILGIIHTAISIFALFAGAFCLITNGKIIPSKPGGKAYIVLTIITCLTALPIMKTGHFTGAHGLGVFILVLLPIGVYAKSIRFFGKLADYIQILVLSTTLFLSCIPAIVETLTRLPVSQPIASGPADPLIQKALAILTLAFFLGVTYQIVKLKLRKKSTQTPGADMKLS